MRDLVLLLVLLIELLLVFVLTVYIAYACYGVLDTYLRMWGADENFYPAPRPSCWPFV
jgi:hypothetical protein